MKKIAIIGGGISGLYIANLFKVYSAIFTTKHIIYQIIIEFDKFILKKLENKTWEVMNGAKTIVYNEIGNDYKSHTLQNDETKLMLKVYRNGSILEDYINHLILSSNGIVKYDCEFKENKIINNEKLLIINCVFFICISIFSGLSKKTETL